MDKFFDLLREKPLVDLQLDSLTNFINLDFGDKDQKLADLCRSNTAMRDRSRIDKLSAFTYLH